MPEYIEDEHTVDAGDLYSYLAECRAGSTCEDAVAIGPLPNAIASEAIELVTTEDICAALDITVSAFHRLKTKLQRVLAGSDVTIIGQAVGPHTGWGWRLVGNAGDVVGKQYLISRLRNIRGRHVSNRAVASSMIVLADAPGITLGLGSTAADDGFRSRLRDLEREEGRLVEDIDRMLVDIVA